MGVLERLNDLEVKGNAKPKLEGISVGRFGDSMLGISSHHLSFATT